MNYQKIYDQLIAKRRQNKIIKNDCYCECHHIIPKSLGGLDNDHNKVNLTAREHYIAYILLVKIAEQKFGKDSAQYEKMIRAVTFFNTCKNNNKLAERKSINFNSHVYACIREEFAKVSSICMTGKLVGEKNGMYGRKRTKEEKEKISKTRLERGCGKGKNNSMYGVSLNNILSPDQIKLWHKRQSDSLSGKNNPCYGRKWMHIKGSSRKEDRIYVKEAECQKYLDLGYIFGMKDNKV